MAITNFQYVASPTMSALQAAVLDLIDQGYQPYNFLSFANSQFIQMMIQGVPEGGSVGTVTDVNYIVAHSLPAMNSEVISQLALGLNIYGPTQQLDGVLVQTMTDGIPPGGGGGGGGEGGAITMGFSQAAYNDPDNGPTVGPYTGPFNQINWSLNVQPTLSGGDNTVANIAAIFGQYAPVGVASGQTIDATSLGSNFFIISGTVEEKAQIVVDSAYTNYSTPLSLTFFNAHSEAANLIFANTIIGIKALIQGTHVGSGNPMVTVPPNGRVSIMPDSNTFTLYVWGDLITDPV